MLNGSIQLILSQAKADPRVAWARFYILLILFMNVRFSLNFHIILNCITNFLFNMISCEFSGLIWLHLCFVTLILIVMIIIEFPLNICYCFIFMSALSIGIK
jgi:hypothetical protein